MHGPEHKALRKSFLSLFTTKALGVYVTLQVRRSARPPPPAAARRRLRRHRALQRSRARAARRTRWCAAT
jgi:hypothetical protein